MGTSMGIPGHGGATIFALGTPAGKSALAVIRISGPKVNDIADSILAPINIGRANALVPRQACYRRIVHPSTGVVLDHGIALLFPAPASATGEDVLELHIHGGRATVSAVIDALASFGASHDVRPALPGEFTRRAFSHGKLDLTSVEGLADLLNADTELQRRQALQQASGQLASLYDGWRAELLRACAHVEAVLDFAADQDGVDDATVMAGVVPRVQALLMAMKGHLASSTRGELIRDGVGVVILGPPNAGKSSLLNSMARRPAAIVSPIPGTTRDVVEVQLDLSGVPVVLADTAGLRERAADAVEEEGIRRALARADKAHVRLVLLDVGDVQGVGRHDRHVSKSVIPGHLLPFFEPTSSSPESTLLVLNKCDRDGDGSNTNDTGGGTPKHGKAGGDMVPVHRISCATGHGIPSLLARVEAMARDVAWGGAHTPGAGQGDDAPVITRARHRAHVVGAIASLERFLAGTAPLSAAHSSSSLDSAAMVAPPSNSSTRPRSILPPDMAAEELRQATRSLAALTGRVDVEELLDVIFRDFCIGK